MTLEEIKMQYAKERSRNGWPLIMIQDTFNCKQMDEVAQRYAQSQTQKIQEQNAELVDLVERCKDVIYAYNDYRPTATGNEILQAIQDRLTKYNHLKSNTNG